MQDIATIQQWSKRSSEPWLPCSRHKPGFYVSLVMSDVAFEARLKRLHEESMRERIRARQHIRVGRVTMVK